VRAPKDDSIGITTDEQLSEWFELNKDKGEVHIVGQINDFEGPLQFSPTKRRLHPSVRNLPSTAHIDCSYDTNEVEAEEDHQLGGGGGGVEVEVEVEVLQGLLLCLMCRNDHRLGYVITSH